MSNQGGGGGVHNVINVVQDNLPEYLDVPTRIRVFGYTAMAGLASLNVFISERDRLHDVRYWIDKAQEQLEYR